MSQCVTCVVCYSLTPLNQIHVSVNNRLETSALSGLANQNSSATALKETHECDRCKLVSSGYIKIETLSITQYALPISTTNV